MEDEERIEEKRMAVMTIDDLETMVGAEKAVIKEDGRRRNRVAPIATAQHMHKFVAHTL